MSWLFRIYGIDLRGQSDTPVSLWCKDEGLGDGYLNVFLSCFYEWSPGVMETFHADFSLEGSIVTRNNWAGS